MVAAIQIRQATEGDAAFLARMFRCAVDWNPDQPVADLSALLKEPSNAHYIDGWKRSTDFGAVAQDDSAPVGAAWCRYFTAEDPSYGFVDAQTPEVAVAVLPDRRGAGIGTALLHDLHRRARDMGIARVSLSVETENPAVRLYRSLGYRQTACDDNAFTMILDL